MKSGMSDNQVGQEEEEEEETGGEKRRNECGAKSKR